MTTQIDLTMRNNTEDLIRVMDEAEGFVMSLGASPGVLYKANLVLEEILTNIVKYAFPDREAHEVRVNLACQESELTLRFVDDGPAFNPLTSPPPHPSDSVLDCPVGGLGIYLVCKTVDRITYERDQNTNVLTVGLKLETA